MNIILLHISEISRFPEGDISTKEYINFTSKLLKIYESICKYNMDIIVNYY